MAEVIKDPPAYPLKENAHHTVTVRLSGQFHNYANPIGNDQSRTKKAVPVRFAEVDLREALDIAITTGLYAYDAYVLEVARVERLPLLTLDRALERAARRLGLSVLEVTE